MIRIRNGSDARVCVARFMHELDEMITRYSSECDLTTLEFVGALEGTKLNLWEELVASPDNEEDDDA